jgi:hypothetical protein
MPRLMHPHAATVLGRTCHGIRGHLDVQDIVVVDGLTVEAQRARAPEPPSEAACPSDVPGHVGQRIPGLTDSDQPTVRDEEPNGLVVEPHSSQIRPSRDPAKAQRLAFEPHHDPNLTV